jgi:hypothetical protein
MTVGWHRIVSLSSVRIHEKVWPVPSPVVIVRRFLLASLSLLARSNIKVIVAPELVRWHVVSWVSIVELSSLHWHHASLAGTTPELFPFVSMGVVVIPFRATSSKPDSYLEVGALSSFLVSPLV